MDSHTDTSYQDDILKVKQIWNDIKQVQKYNNKTQINSKNIPSTSNKQKSKHQNKTPKDKIQFHKTKSQLNFKQQKQLSPDNIISFSTISQPSHDQKQFSSDHPKNQPNLKSKYLQQHNFKHSTQQKDKQLSILRVTNQRLKDQIHKLQRQLSQRDNLISRLKQRQYDLLGVTSKFNSEKVQAISQSAQYMNFKNDSRRLMKMLQTTQQYQYFAKIGLDDGGTRFLSNTNKKSSIDVLNHTKNMHFCSCNSQFIPQHYFWVPQKVYDFGKQFIKQRRGENISQAEIELLLYELNKIWRERQKRIINTFNSSKALDISKYKRKLQNVNRLVKQNQKIGQ